jgi:hypothetical protein
MGALRRDWEGLVDGMRLKQRQSDDGSRLGPQDARPERGGMNKGVFRRTGGASRRSIAAWIGLPPSNGHATRTTFSAISGVISGMVSRSHCSAASIAIAVSRAMLRFAALVRSVLTGMIRSQPSSVAFCTTSSVAVFRSGANISQVSGSGACSRTRTSTAKLPRSLRSPVMRAVHSPSRPLNSRTSSPTERRITLAR